MNYPDKASIAWQFDTNNIRVIMHAEPEYDAPDFDDDGQTAADIEAGRIEWFCAFVSVWYGDDAHALTYLAHDSLGCCAYKSVQEFISSHRDHDAMNRNSSIMRATRGNVSICHYFPSMVSIAIGEARAKLRKLGALKVRPAAE